jgi:Arc/MetJ-type ribon-helix-helix transcriptional regulator
MTRTGKTTAGKGFEEQAAAPYTSDAPSGGPGLAPRSTQGITLVPEHQRWVDQAVAEGRFETADEAVAFALDHFLPLLEPDEDDDWMKPLIEEAMNDPRPSIPIDEVLEKLRARAAQLRQR